VNGSTTHADPKSKPKKKARKMEEIKYDVREDGNLLAAALLIWILRNTLKLGDGWEMKLSLLESSLQDPAEDIFLNNILSRLLMPDKELQLLNPERDDIPMGMWKKRLYQQLKEWAWQPELLQEAIDRLDSDEDSSSEVDDSGDESGSSSSIDGSEDDEDSCKENHTCSIQCINRAPETEDDMKGIASEHSRAIPQASLENQRQGQEKMWKKFKRKELATWRRQDLEDELNDLSLVLRLVPNLSNLLELGPSFFEQIPTNEKANILLASCEQLVSRSETARDVIARTHHSDLRPTELGEDSSKRTYYHFHQFSLDCRLYRTRGPLKNARDKGLELVCSDIESLSSFLKGMCKSSGRKDRELGEALEHLEDHMKEQLEIAQKKEIREERVKALMAMPRRRSSRNTASRTFQNDSSQTVYGTMFVSPTL